MTTAAANAILTPTNYGIIGTSLEWGAENVALMREMELSKSHLTVIGGMVEPETGDARVVSLDTFRLVYTADMNAQLPRGRVNDTLARLTLISSPEEIGSSMRGLRAYPLIADKFEPRFRGIVAMADEISASTFLSAEAREALSMEAFDLASGLWVEPPEHASDQTKRLALYQHLIDAAIGGVPARTLSAQLAAIWGKHTEDLLAGGFLGEEAILSHGFHMMDDDDVEVS